MSGNEYRVIIPKYAERYCAKKHGFRPFIWFIEFFLHSLGFLLMCLQEMKPIEPGNHDGNGQNTQWKYISFRTRKC